MNSSSFSSRAPQQQSGDLFLSDRFYLTQRRSAAVISSRLFYLFPMAMLAITSVGAQADELDTFQFRVGENIMHQSNVFYLSDSANPQSDKVAVTSAGLKINKAYGRELITHGDLWSGANMGASGISPHHLYDDVYTYTVQEGGLNFWFNNGFMQSLAELIHYFPTMAK